MSTYHLQIALAREEAALLRLLGTTERRGFQVVSLEAHPHSADAGLFAINLTVQGARDITLLQRQLERLVEVETVTCTTP